jgi:predicted nucleic acid-binding protein
MSDKTHKLFLDTSVILRFYDPSEDGHRIVKYWIEQHNTRKNLLPCAKNIKLFIPDVAISESIAVFYRRRSEGVIKSKEILDNYIARLIKDSNSIFTTFPSDSGLFSTDIEKTIKIYDEALEANAEVLTKKKIENAGDGFIGVMDNVIINTAIKFKEQYAKMAFVTADTNQEVTARRVKLDVYNPLNWKTIPVEYRPVL